jgi:hypothetical protein
MPIFATDNPPPQVALQEWIDGKNPYFVLTMQDVVTELTEGLRRNNQLDATTRRQIKEGLPKAARCSAAKLLSLLQNTGKTNDLYDEVSIRYIELCLRNQYKEGGADIRKDGIEKEIDAALVHAVGVSAERYLARLEQNPYIQTRRAAEFMADTVRKYWPCRDGKEAPSSLRGLKPKPLPPEIEARLQRAVARPVYVPSLKLALGAG